jgi:hypothetical protein
MRRRRSISALVCALALAMPAGALAQSAGDNQYQDPFSGKTPTGGGNSGGGGGGGNTSGGGGGNSSQASPQVAQSAPSAATAQAQPAQGQTLPRTGFPAFLPFAYGFVLLLAGAALRRASGARPRTR